MSNIGRIVWHELVTPDPKAAAGFYGELFGWTAKSVEMGGGAVYTMFSAGGVDVAGGMATPKGAKLPPHWLGYATVADVEAAVKQAPGVGFKVAQPATDIPNVGRFAVLVDGQGGVLAPFEPSGDARPDPDAVPVGHFCWDELLTSDPEAAIKAYSAVYGWTDVARDMGPMGTYHLQMRGEKRAGGIMKATRPGQPSAWLHYVHVSDVDERAGRVAGLGGKVVLPGTDIPGTGRFAVVSDAQGAAIGLFKGV